MNNPLILPADLFPDMTPDEMALEIEMMFLRSQAIYDAISGNIPIQEMIELVEFTGTDIDQWSIDCELASGKW